MKHLIIFFFCLLLPGLAIAQEKMVDKITLKTGEVFFGEIQGQDSAVVVIKMATGVRFQFQMTEVKKIEKVTVANQQKEEAALKNKENIAFGSAEKIDWDNPDRNRDVPRNSNVGGMLEASGALDKGKDCFGFSPSAQFSLAIGNKKVMNKPLFAGLGIAYHYISVENATSYEFLPVFLRLQSRLTDKTSAPFIGMDAGYAIALKSTYKGGPMVQLSGGWAYRFNQRSSVFVGAFLGLQSFSSNLTETQDGLEYKHFDTSTLTSLGVKAGLQF